MVKVFKEAGKRLKRNNIQFQVRDDIFMNHKWKIICECQVPFIEPARKVVKEDNEIAVFDNGEHYHKVNKLNDLTSKEWLKFQKSWFIASPSPRKEDVLLHPAKFPEDIIREFIQFFTKKGQIVLDPMLGTGSTLIACAECGRHGIGIELSEKYAEISKKRISKLSSQQNLLPQNKKSKVTMKVISGDSRHIDKMNLPQIDYCITSPPYWNMLNEKGYETQEKRRKLNLDVVYSDSQQDLGNIHDYEKFIGELVKIYRHFLISTCGCIVCSFHKHIIHIVIDFSHVET